MSGTKGDRKGLRLREIVSITFIVVLLFIGGAAIGGANGAGHQSASRGSSPAVHPLTIATGTIYINESLPVGFSGKEYVSINNGSAQALPLVLTSQTSAAWVTVLNSTQTVKSLSSHRVISQVDYRAETPSSVAEKANTGAPPNATLAFKQPITSQVWLDYAWQNFSSWQLVSSGLVGATANVTANITGHYGSVLHAVINSSTVVDVEVPAGYNLTLSITAHLNGPSTSGAFGSYNYTSFSFVVLSVANNGTSWKDGTEFFDVVTGYVNGTAYWSGSDVQITTPGGAFFGGAQTIWSDLVGLADVWIFVVVLLVVLGGAYWIGTASHSRRRRR